MFFVSVNRGFTTGGFNTGAFNDPLGAAEIFDPEILVSYELGMKSTLLQDRLRFNATTFLYDYKDLQVFTFTPSGQQFIENASDAKASGLELEVQALLTERLEVSASAGLLRTEYENFVRGAEDLSGNRMIGAPQEQLGLRVKYGLPVSFGTLGARADLTYTGHRYYDERELDEISSEGSDYNLDGSLTWTDLRQRFSVTVWAKNLTDETTIIDVVDVGLFGYQNVWYNMPRTYGVTFNYDF
jgi:iron complex outermembrane receptor protein